MYRIPNGAAMAVGVGLLSLASLIVLQPSHAQTASTSSDQSSTSTSTTTTTPGSTTTDQSTPGTSTPSTAPGANVNGNTTGATMPGTSPNTGITPGTNPSTGTAPGTTPNTGMTPGTPNNGINGNNGLNPGAVPNNTLTPVPGTGISNSPTYGNPAPGGINTTPGYSTNVTPGFAGNNSLPGYGLNSSNGVTTNTLNSTPSAQINYNSGYSNMPDFSTWGGAGYDGNPDTDVNSSFIGAGGGPYNFDIKMALARMGGHVWAEDEILNLQAQFGPLAVQKWRDTFQFAVLDSYLQARKAGIDISWKQTYSGPLLGQKVIEAGENGDHNFRAGYFFDKTASSGIHHSVMRDIWVMDNGLSLRDFHRITNQAMTDLAHQLGFWDVHAGDVADMTYDNTSPQPMAPALSNPGTAPLPSNNGSTPNPAQ